jgi:ADP-ribosylglycohydrolase
MLGAIAGDVIGSVHEGGPPQSKAFPLFTPRSRFTDDTVLTVAIADAILTASDYGAALRLWGRRYPRAGYGGLFRDWLDSADPQPYNSYGNGSAMRVSAIGWAFNDLATVMAEAKRSAEVTHNHPEGIKGAQAVAGAVLLARTGQDKDQILRFLGDRLDYDCSSTLDELRSRGSFDVTCQGTIPSAAVAFFESTDFEDALRNAVSLGGDADTLGCIAGAIAEAFYGETPADIQREVIRRLDVPLRRELELFARVYGVPMRPDPSGEGEAQ